MAEPLPISGPCGQSIIELEDEIGEVSSVIGISESASRVKVWERKKVIDNTIKKEREKKLY